MTRVLVAIFLVTWGLTTHGKYSVTGDEPHYLMVAHSLAADRDLDLSNNYAADDGARFGAAGLQPDLHARRSASGRFLPVHDVGMPLAIVPVYMAARALSGVPADATLRRFRMNRGLFTYSIVSLAIIFLSTAAAGLTMSALARDGATRRVACAIVAVAWLSPPVISNDFLIFPEPFALFITAAVVVRTANREPLNREPLNLEPWNWRDSVTVALLSALPWFHRKFAFYAVALLAILIWKRASAVRALSAGAKTRVAVMFAILPLALAIWTLRQWGNLGGPLTLDRLPFSMSAFAHGLAGTLLDRENGLIWWAPVYALLPAAWWIGRRGNWPWLAAVAALLVPAAAHDQWWGGFSPAGRFLLPLIPIFCLVARPLAERAVLRYCALVLLVPQAIMTAYAWQHPRLLWPQGDGENRILAILLPPLGDAYRAIPSLRTAPDTAWTAVAVLLFVLLALNAAAVAATRRQYSMK